MIPPVCPLFMLLPNRLEHIHISCKRAPGTFGIWLLLYRPACKGRFPTHHGGIARTCGPLGLSEKRLQLVWR